MLLRRHVGQTRKECFQLRALRLQNFGYVAIVAAIPNGDMIRKRWQRAEQVSGCEQVWVQTV